MSLAKAKAEKMAEKAKLSEERERLVAEGGAGGDVPEVGLGS